MKFECWLETTSFEYFVFFETGKLVILINGFQKKSQKTPKREIELALKLKAEYENEKFNNSRRI
jgi:phage-related protein